MKPFEVRYYYHQVEWAYLFGALALHSPSSQPQLELRHPAETLIGSSVDVKPY